MKRSKTVILSVINKNDYQNKVKLSKRKKKLTARDSRA